MGFLWHEIRARDPADRRRERLHPGGRLGHDPRRRVSTAAALVIGLPIGLTIGLGRFRGRRALHVARQRQPCPAAGDRRRVRPAVRAPAGPVRLAALSRSRSSGVHRPDDPRAAVHRRAHGRCHPGARRPACSPRRASSVPGAVISSVLALREAKIGVLAAIIAALGAAAVGGRCGGHRRRQHPELRPDAGQAVVQQVNDYANYPYAVGISLVLLALILVLIAILTVAPAARGRSASALPGRRLMPAGSAERCTCCGRSSNARCR